jgi:anti-sigma regulatory factor (Ser/Thr protein kinase)
MHTPATRALARTVSLTYPGAPESVRTVRADLRALLGDCPLADDVILCGSELAANAAVHSRSRLPGGAFTVSLRIDPGRSARIEVEDDGGPWAAAASGAGYHGLDIVAAVVSDWGIDGNLGARTVWARLDWPRPS